jgi:L-alanine-DL-glutamate epimerase-like enolase superfamily enzyme
LKFLNKFQQRAKKWDGPDEPQQIKRWALQKGHPLREKSAIDIVCWDIFGQVTANQCALY